jgi:hypothetical protein
MKIQLECRLNNQAHQLCCVACQQSFTPDRLRTLLCHDDGAIEGDVCAKCVKLGTSHIRQGLKTRSLQLFQRNLNGDTSLANYRAALELSELADRVITVPPIYQRWWKRLTIFVAETEALELGRRESIDCHH